MIEDTEEIKVVSVVPRCQTCNRHTVYIIKNKKNGQTKYFCALCAPLQILSYNNKDEWEVIELQ